MDVVPCEQPVQESLHEVPVHEQEIQARRHAQAQARVLASLAVHEAALTQAEVAAQEADASKDR